ncbi:MAG TPA: hypothetical protein VFN96_05965 [Gemmatimonadales bacterium]|nr:hypothetical protein [Gemmatimonadales bacterium]
MLPPLTLLLALTWGCGGGGSVGGVPAGVDPARGPAPAPADGLGAGTGAAWYYRLPTLTRYRITRVDSLAMGQGASARPQVSAKVAHVTVRSEPGNRLSVSLDSVNAPAGSRISYAAVDSVRGLRWESASTPRGRSAPFRASIRTVLAEQLGQALDLLFQQLPSKGVRVGDDWSDSEQVDLHLDAFAAKQTVSREVRATTPARAGQGIGLEVSADLTRKGTATQGGVRMQLDGSGKRVASYRLAPGGWPARMTARDSLSLTVRTGDGTTVPVVWITQLVVESDAPGR